MKSILALAATLCLLLAVEARSIDDQTKPSLAGLLKLRLHRVPELRLSPRDLSSDFDDFLALLPMGEVFDIFIDALSDKEVQRVIVYMFSNRFAEIIAEMDEIREFRDVVDFGEAAGLGLRTFMDNLKEILNISPPPKSVGYLANSLMHLIEVKLNDRNVRNVGGLLGLVHALRDVVPWDEFWDLYADKMENSPDFVEFIETMDSEERKALTKALDENERFKELSAELTAAGVDVAGLIRITRQFLGLIPAPRSVKH